MNLLLLQRDDFDAGGHARITGPRAKHIRDVLRAAPGDRLRIGLLDGPRGHGEVQAVQDDTVALACSFESAPPPRPVVDLLLALPRPKVLKRLWSQLAALGVGHLLLTNAARVERNYFDTHVLDPAFFTPLLIEGLQQAQDTRLPQVTVHRRFRPLVEDELDARSDAAVRLVADPSGDTRVGGALAGAPTGRILLAVGPEGGWVPFELDLLRARGFIAVRMGARTLRTDTACLALLALVHDARGNG